MNIEFKNRLTKAIAKRTPNVDEIRQIMIDECYKLQLVVNKEGFEIFKQDLKVTVDNNKIEGYVKSYNFDFDVLSRMCYYYLQIMDANKGKFKTGEDITGYTEFTTYLPKNNHENSSNTIYTAQNCLQILEKMGCIEKVRDYVWKRTNDRRNCCARYDLQAVAFRYLNMGVDTIKVDAPKKIINHVVGSIEKAKDYEVIVMASCLATTVDTKTYKKAKERVNAHARFHREVLANPESWSREDRDRRRKEDDEKYGIELAEASLTKSIGDMSITSVTLVHHDTYGGRIYHRWSVVKKETREKAILRGALASNKLVEIDLSQCNFYILLEVYKKQTGNIPTQVLQLAVMLGMLREIIAIVAEGEYSDFIQGQEVSINFNEITNISTAKKYKQLLKLFTLKAINCKNGSKACHIMDKALARIDKDFAKWISNYRRGFCAIADNASGKQSMVPYITQKNEVEFMYGYTIKHAIPMKKRIVKETEVISFERTQKGVTDFCIEQGVNFFIPIHDAIVVLERDIEKVINAFRQAAYIRGYNVPMSKIENYLKRTEKKNISELKYSELDNSVGVATMYYYDGTANEVNKKLHYCYKLLKQKYNAGQNK